ncbi:MAG: RNA polymerase sigma-70 factor [Polaribacter sp.]
MKKNSEQNNNFINQLIKGDEKAYAYMVDTYHIRLCVYANNLINDSLSAEDIVQNVFIKIWKRRKKLKIKSSFESLLYRSVYNEFIDQYRTNLVILKSEQRYYNHMANFLEEYDQEKIDKAMALVNKAVNKLPKKCQEIFKLSKFEGLTNMEIANYLHISIKTVEGQISTAYKKIRKKLKSKMYLQLFMNTFKRIFGTS